MLFLCERKHKLFNKQYQIKIEKNQIIIDQKNNISKYCLPFFSSPSFDWILIDSKLIGFQFFFQRKMIIFSMKHEECLQFYLAVKNFIFFSNLNKFFKPIYKIGKGAYSNVVKVICIFNQNMYACKCVEINEEFSENDIMNEIQIHSILNHKNIVKLQAISRTQNHFYILMELPNGDTLRQYMNQKIKLSEEEILIILYQLLNGINYIHQLNIIHRDIKPENIILHHQDNQIIIKLIDFGLATNLNQLNNDLKICGTGGYVAPEILNNSDNPQYDKKCDIFSCGVILYELLTHKQLFFRKSNSDILMNNKNFNYQEIDYSNINYHFQKLLKLMLELDPQKRIDSNQALEILEGIKNQIYEIPQDGKIQQLPILIQIKPKSDPNLFHIDF